MTSVQNATPVEDNRRQRAAARRWNDDTANAAPIVDRNLRAQWKAAPAVRLTIDGDLPSLVYHMERKPFGERLKAAVSSGNAACSQDHQGGARALAHIKAGP